MAVKLKLTICFAAIHTVLTENFLPHMSNKSSRLGPRRSMTRMLCKPSCPKWYICGIPASMRLNVSKVVGYRGRSTNCSLLGYGMNDIHHEAEVLRLFSAPMTIWEIIFGGMQWQCNAQTWWRRSENWEDWFLNVTSGCWTGRWLNGHQGQLAFEDNPKRAFTDFLADTVMNTHEICCRGLVWVRSHNCRTCSG